MSSILLEEGIPSAASDRGDTPEKRFSATRLFRHSTGVSLQDRLSLLLASTLGFVLLIALSPLLLVLGAGMLGARVFQHLR